MPELTAALKDLAHSLAALHEVVAVKRLLVPEGEEEHRAIAYCTCRVAETYRIVASTYRTMRAEKVL
jgi:hypothetical protein